MLHAKEIVHIKFKNTQCLGFYFGTDSELMMSDCLGDVPADPYNQREPVQQVNEVPRPRKIKQALKSYFQNQCHEQGLFNTDLEWLVTGMSIMGHREICYTAFVITDSVVSDNRLDAEAGWHQVDLSEEDTSGMSEDEKSKLVIKHIAKCASTAKINTSFEVQDSADVMSSTGLVSKLTFTIKPSSLMRQFNINETSINRAVDDIIGKIRHARNQEALEGVVGEASFGSQSGQNPQEAAGQAPFISQSVPVSQTCTDKAFHHSLSSWVMVPIL